jgi:hypothetical protein
MINIEQKIPVRNALTGTSFISVTIILFRYSCLFSNISTDVKKDSTYIQELELKLTFRV